MKRAGILGLVLGLIFWVLPTQIARAVLPCTSPTSATQGNVCITEVQTIGATGDETEDFVILSNLTGLSFAPSNLRLQYLNSAGVLDSSLSPGSFLAGETKVYVSSNLKPVNPSAGTLSLPLASSGGSLRVVRATSSSNPTPLTYYDQLSWGSGVVTEGSPVAVQSNAATISRKLVAGDVQDTDNNSADFETLGLDCQGALFNEVQPFVTNAVGESIDAWVELKGTSDTHGDCSLLTAAGDNYDIPASDIPANNELVAITGATDSLGQPIPLHIGDTSGQVWLAGASRYGGVQNVYLPIDTSAYASLIKGQSWALVGGTWQRTYSPTPSAENIFSASLPVADDPTACDTIRITELYPNPVGDEAGNEWIEFYNDSDLPAALGRCEVSVAGTNYNFLPTDTLGPHEWRALNGLYTSDGADKTISLRNTDETLVALLRIRGDNSTDTIQAFNYSNAPEGESWARFGTEWFWTYALTPSEDNVLQTTPPVPGVTEFAGTATPGGSGSGADAVSPPLSITELLPNPASPQTDENDEYIELFNPNPDPVVLDGYKVQTGSNYSYSFTINNQTIPAGGYLVITSGASGLTLANTAGRAQLLDPSGAVISETDPYEDAGEGDAWALIDGKWQWTSTPTEGAANVLTAVLSGSVAAVKKTTTKTTTTAKPKTSSSSAVKVAKTTKPTGSSSSSQDDNSPKTSALHPAALVAVGALAVVYAVYEYRQDAANWIYKLKRNRATRRAGRQ